ncbi:MAG: ribosome maturation factor RimP [Gammaproteobacteria bacterium]|nr:ribosome maturation factor RimP [Gammaproteobacteria bacterium]MDX2487152.1 ribosome maturation factor RimP [Gammaproteobacteria bacterium]
MSWFGGMDRLEKKLSDLFEPVIESMAYELVGVELTGSGNGTILRIYIDAEKGITVDDCQAVSYQVSGILDVEDPMQGHYTLEVSSPGIDRPLVKPEHFDQFTGELVKIRSTEAVLGRKNFKGILESFDGEYLYVAVDNEVYEIPFDIVEKANLVPILDS